MPKTNQKRIKTGGRKKGTPNQITKSLRLLLHELLEQDFPKLKKELNKLEGKEYVNAYLKLMEYEIPKQKSVEQKFDVSNLSTNEVENLFQIALKKVS